jgi:riboflavin synthase
LGDWNLGDRINLERCMQLGGRLDGHMVQGHVDATGLCTDVEETNGSWRYTFQISPEYRKLLVDKGSVTVNGVSLTVVDPGPNSFSVAIIPYTWEHTNFHKIEKGHRVNLEFDVIGKYIAQHIQAYQVGH